MRVLIAFDKFKDSMSARKACEVAAGAVLEVHPNARIIEAPLSDGGEGFCEILTNTRGGVIQRHRVKGPLFDEVEACLGFVQLEDLDVDLREFLSVPASGSLAIVEMAQASGLERLVPQDRDPWKTTTCGTGELLRKAVDQGASAILLGIGGSATNDLGLGALEALGLRFLDADGKTISNIVPQRWVEVAQMQGEPLELPCVRIACDVGNPLLGPRGAAAVYGPQKGLKPEDLERMEQGMERMGKMLCRHFGESAHALEEASSGAAGGIGFGLRVACGARYVPGFQLVWQWLALQERLRQCDVLITGEGRFDSSSLEGKGPGALIRAAAAMGKEVHVFAGRVDDELGPQLPPGFGPDGLNEISPREIPLQEALDSAPNLLRTSVRKAI